MNYRIFTFLLVLVVSDAFAKIAPVYKIEYRESKTIEFQSDITISDASQAMTLLKAELPELVCRQSSLELFHTTQSPLGTHYTFNQLYNGVEVWQASIRLHVDKSGKVFLIQSTLATIEPDNIPEYKSPANRLIVLDEGYRWGNYSIVDNEYGVPYEQLQIGSTIVWRQEGRLHWSFNDTTVTGYVFLVNPINSARVVYGPPYVDSSDANTEVLRNERKLVNFTATYRNDTFYLENSWLKFKDFSNPVTPETFSVNDSFLFNRSEPGFEDVNVYYHITNMADYVTAHGYGNLIHKQLLVDAHGQFGSDNSSFNYLSNPVELEYGTGGVDDAEDGEVVIHEFAHSLSQMASPFTFVGSERRAMEEGNADYFAVSYSRRYGDYNWERVFSWDAYNEYWEGFTAKASKNYKTDLMGIMNEDREIWSSALTCIYEKLGQEVTDSLVLSYLYLQAKNTTMPQMANAILKVDTMLWQGKNYEDVKSCFVHYGILDWSVSVPDDPASQDLVNLRNTMGWATGTGAMEIDVISDLVRNIEIFDVTGKLIFKEEVRAGQTSFIASESFKSGMYVVRINTEAGPVLTKLFHY